MYTKQALILWLVRGNTLTTLIVIKFCLNKFYLLKKILLSWYLQILKSIS